MKFDMAGVRVMLAMPTHRPLEPATVRSLLETQGLCHQRGIVIDIEMQCGSSLVHHARTKAANSFLRGDCTHLFWVDSDMVWSGADFLRVLAFGTKLECVCGIYTCKIDPPRFCLNVDDMREVVLSNEYGCISWEGMGLGLGFTCVQRKVIEELAVKAPRLLFPDIPEPVPHIFRCDDKDGKARGEDMAFFSDVRDLGYTVNIDPNVTLGHMGPKEYRASVLDYLDHVQRDAA